MSFPPASPSLGGRKRESRKNRPSFPLGRFLFPRLLLIDKTYDLIKQIYGQLGDTVIKQIKEQVDNPVWDRINQVIRPIRESGIRFVEKSRQ